MSKASASTAAARPRPRRRSPGWIPNQHGAWAMLAAPLLVGIVASGPAWVHLPLALFWFAGYLAFHATSLWLKSGRRQRWLPPMRAYAPAAALLGAVVALLEPRLLLWVPAFLPPLAVGLWAAAHRHDRDLLAGLTTVLASALIAVVAFDAGTTGPLTRGWQLALVQFLYFGGTVFYVKSAIREQGRPGFLRLSVAAHGLATAVATWVSWSLLPVFAALTLRAAVVPGRRPTPKQIGIAEIVATVVVSLAALAVT